ncbi:MAG: nitroreductase family protein [Eubacteriales bacterium]|nr:nitroreductase family protein [Eubacteriales bacterium]
METLECIKTRRSVRKFTEQPVTENELRQAVAAAAYAPSWKNTQIARYIVVTDPEKKQRLADECMLGFAFNQKTASRAPALIVLTMRTGRSGFERDGSFSTPQGAHWQSFDAGIAAQTFCLAAHELGLGTVIMGIYDERKVAAVVGVPEGQTVAALIAVGHPAEEPAAPKRKDVDELVSFQ